jgi:hypothetical protein
MWHRCGVVLVDMLCSSGFVALEWWFRSGGSSGRVGAGGGGDDLVLAVAVDVW